jgi:hypothetical protein
VGDALDELWSRHVGLRDRVLTERVEAKTTGDDEICIMPAVSGG